MVVSGSSKPASVSLSLAKDPKKSEAAVVQYILDLIGNDIAAGGI
jgi:hypothetical protein